MPVSCAVRSSPCHLVLLVDRPRPVLDSMVCLLCKENWAAPVHAVYLCCRKGALKAFWDNKTQDTLQSPTSLDSVTSTETPLSMTQADVAASVPDRMDTDAVSIEPTSPLAEFAADTPLGNAMPLGSIEPSTPLIHLASNTLVHDTTASNSIPKLDSGDSVPETDSLMPLSTSVDAPASSVEATASSPEPAANSLVAAPCDSMPAGEALPAVPHHLQDGLAQLPQHAAPTASTSPNPGHSQTRPSAAARHAASAADMPLRNATPLDSIEDHVLPFCDPDDLFEPWWKCGSLYRRQAASAQSGEQACVNCQPLETPKKR